MKLRIRITKDAVWKFAIGCVDILEDVFILMCLTMVQAFVIFDTLFGVTISKAIWLGICCGGLWIAMVIVKIVLNVIRNI